MISVRSNWPVLLLVDAEIGRQLHRAAHARRHVDERAVGEHRRVERGEEIVADRHHRAEIFLHQLGMLAERLRDRHEDHAGLGQLRLEGGGDRDGIEHRVDRDRGSRCRSRPRRRLRASGSGRRAAFPLAQRNAELLVGRAGSPDRSRRATSAPSSSARNSSRCPGSRSAGTRPAPSSARAWSASAGRRRAATSSIQSGSFFFAEMKRTVSSDRPFGALSDSISVSNPYLYWSTSIRRT